MGKSLDGVGDGPSASDRGASNASAVDRRSSVARLPAGVVTFIMTDIEGSTRLLRELGEVYAELLTTHQALLRGTFIEHRGVEVDAEGDALFFVFADAQEAVAACLEAQRALANHSWPLRVEVRVRIGAHTSEASPVGRRYVNLAVHQVARISAGAHGGQVVLSEVTATAVANRLPDGAWLQDLGSFRLRGFPNAQRLF